MRHKNKTVMLKTQKICVFPQSEMVVSHSQFTALWPCSWNSKPGAGGGGGGAVTVCMWGEGLVGDRGREGQLTWQNPRHNLP
jgi:hypothetical protein